MFAGEVSASQGISVVSAMSEDLPVSLRPVSCTHPSAYQYSACSNSHRLTTPARSTCHRSVRHGVGKHPVTAASRHRTQVLVAGEDVGRRRRRQGRHGLTPPSRRGPASRPAGRCAGWPRGSVRRAARPASRPPGSSAAGRRRRSTASALARTASRAGTQLHGQPLGDALVDGGRRLVDQCGRPADGPAVRRRPACAGVRRGRVDQVQADPCRGCHGGEVDGRRLRMGAVRARGRAATPSRRTSAVAPVISQARASSRWRCIRK